MVPQTSQTACGQASYLVSNLEDCQAIILPLEGASFGEKTAIDWMCAFRKSLGNQGISIRTQEIMLDS